MFVLEDSVINKLIEARSLSPARVGISIEVHIEAVEFKRHVEPAQVAVNRRGEAQLGKLPPQQAERLVDLTGEEGNLGWREDVALIEAGACLLF